VTVGIRRGLALFAFVAAAHALPGPAGAHTETVKDANDRPGLLDISSTSTRHVGSTVRHTVTTFATWRNRVIGESTPNYVAVGFDLSGDARFERYAIAFVLNGRLRAFFIRPNGLIVRTLGVSRPNLRSLTVSVPRSLLTGAGGYTWAALTLFRQNRRNILDWAPDTDNVLHDLTRPLVELGSIPYVSTSTSTTTSFPVSFTLDDPARSAGLDWRVERRDVEGTTWETAGEGEGEGPFTVDVGGEQGGHYLLRVVGSDRHGNRTTSRNVPVTVPLDDANAVFSYSGSWETTPLGLPFLGTTHTTSAAGASLSYTYTASFITNFVWIGPGTPYSGSGQAALSLDGGLPIIWNPPSPPGDRVRYTEWRGVAPGTHTLTITNLVDGFSIGIDGIVVVRDLLSSPLPHAATRARKSPDCGSANCAPGPRVSRHDVSAGPSKRGLYR
jgi:hypothetical protein